MRPVRASPGQRLEFRRHRLAHVAPPARSCSKTSPSSHTRREIGDLVGDLPRHDPLAGEHRLLDHYPGGRRAEGDRPPHLPSAEHTLDYFLGNLPVLQSPPCRLQQPCGARDRVSRPARTW